MTMAPANPKPAVLLSGVAGCFSTAFFASATRGPSSASVLPRPPVTVDTAVRTLLDGSLMVTVALMALVAERLAPMQTPPGQAIVWSTWATPRPVPVRSVALVRSMASTSARWPRSPRRACACVAARRMRRSSTLIT